MHTRSKIAIAAVKGASHNNGRRVSASRHTAYGTIYSKSSIFRDYKFDALISAASVQLQIGHFRGRNRNFCGVRQFPYYAAITAEAADCDGAGFNVHPGTIAAKPFFCAEIFTR